MDIYIERERKREREKERESEKGETYQCVVSFVRKVSSKKF